MPSTARRATSSTSRARSSALGDARGGRRARRRASAARPSARPRRRARRAAVAPTCAARSSAAARSPARARRTSRCGRRRSAGASFLRSVASARGGPAPGRASARRHARAYAKGWEEIEGYLARRGSRRRGARARGAQRGRGDARRGEPARERRPRKSRPHGPRGAAAARGGAPAARFAARSSRLPERLREAARLRLRHPALSLRELAEQASPPATKAGMQRRLAKVVELAGSSATSERPRMDGEAGHPFRDSPWIAESRQPRSRSDPCGSSAFVAQAASGTTEVSGNRGFQLQGFSCGPGISR